MFVFRNSPWGDEEHGAVGAASLAAANDDDLIEAEETSELLELRLENISTISAWTFAAVEVDEATQFLSIFKGEKAKLWLIKFYSSVGLH